MKMTAFVQESEVSGLYDHEELLTIWKKNCFFK